MILAMALLIVPLLGVSAGGSINSVSTTNATLVQSSCTVIAESYLTVHVFDEPGQPIPNALVVLNGTYICLDSRLNQSRRTDLNGDVTFAVVPHPATYNVTVILPESYQNRTIIATNLRTPNPTFHTTIRVGLHQLRASIVLVGETCRLVNETAMPTLLFHFECTLGVDYNANDGSHPEVSILWIDSGWGGSFNSTTSQWIRYRPPQGIECLNLTVTVSAPGYESGSDTLGMIDMVIPDPSGGYVHNCPGDGSATTATTVVPSGPVPGFPVESIIIGLALGAVLILFRGPGRWRARRDSNPGPQAFLTGGSEGVHRKMRLCPNPGYPHLFVNTNYSGALDYGPTHCIFSRV